MMIVLVLGKVIIDPDATFECQTFGPAHVFAVVAAQFAALIYGKLYRTGIHLMPLFGQIHEESRLFFLIPTSSKTHTHGSLLKGH